LSFYQRKEIKDAISYFRLTINPDDDEALRRVINYPARGIGDTTVNKLQQAAIKHNVSMWSVVNNPIAYELSLNSGTVKKLQIFASIIQSFIDLNIEGKDALELAQVILRDSTILASVHSDNTPENISKQENLSELLNGIKDFITTKQESGDEDSTGLTHFLAEISLATDQDKNDDDSSGECVTLMTVHAAKGLEFRNVIIVGVEEELFPSLMSSDSVEGVEEERRLLYVAITRAKTNCTITFATSRYRNGQTKQCQMSRFIRDIDSSYLSLSQTSAMTGEFGYTSSRRYDKWNFEDYNSKPIFTKSERKTTIYQKSDTIINKPSVSFNPTLSGGDFANHGVNELIVGMKIQHSRFGVGVIENIFVEDQKIKVNFSELNETKLLMLKFAKFKILK
jgi:DNA helicase-2/ATP-dependent DNA helicase PcrA